MGCLVSDTPNHEYNLQKTLGSEYFNTYLQTEYVDYKNKLINKAVMGLKILFLTSLFTK